MPKSKRAGVSKPKQTKSRNGNQFIWLSSYIFIRLEANIFRQDASLVKIKDSNAMRPNQDADGARVVTSLVGVITRILHGNNLMNPTSQSSQREKMIYIQLQLDQICCLYPLERAQVLNLTHRHFFASDRPTSPVLR